MSKDQQPNRPIINEIHQLYNQSDRTIIEAINNLKTIGEISNHNFDSPYTITKICTTFEEAQKRWFELIINGHSNPEMFKTVIDFNKYLEANNLLRGAMFSPMLTCSSNKEIIVPIENNSQTSKAVKTCQYLLEYIQRLDAPRYKLVSRHDFGFKNIFQPRLNSDTIYPHHKDDITMSLDGVRTTLESISLIFLYLDDDQMKSRSYIEKYLKKLLFVPQQFISPMTKLGLFYPTSIDRLITLFIEYYRAYVLDNQSKDNIFACPFHNMKSQTALVNLYLDCFFSDPIFYTLLKP